MFLTSETTNGGTISFSKWRAKNIVYKSDIMDNVHQISNIKYMMIGMLKMTIDHDKDAILSRHFEIFARVLASKSLNWRLVENISTNHN